LGPPWLGEAHKIREVQAAAAGREAEIGTGVMVRHGSFTPLSRASRGRRGSQRPTSSVWPTFQVYRAYGQREYPVDPRVRPFQHSRDDEVAAEGAAVAREDRRHR